MTATKRRLVALAAPVAAAVALALAGGSSWAAPSGAEPSAAVPPTAGDPARGLQLYLTGCSSCHGVNGDGTSRGPSIKRSGAAAVDFYLTTGRMPLDEPVAQAERRPAVYNSNDIEDLVAYYLHSLSAGDGPAIPPVDPSAGDLGLGNSLYADNCAACHGSGAAGGALGGSVNAPPLRRATPLQVAEAIRTGPGAMPVFGPGAFDQHQVDSVVRYVEYLHSPQDRGGYGLGHLGPIPEGFVAWFLGLGALLLAIRFIGTSD